MYYLFIFESIGTSELLLISVVALIIFGPRKLPEFARTIGKTMAELRRTGDDFKKTWTQEVSFENELAVNNETNLQIKSPLVVENITAKDTDFERNIPVKETANTKRTEIEINPNSKRDWL